MHRPLDTRAELHTVVTAALVFILGAVAPSCGAEPLPVRDCTPGASLACACVGAMGAQLCDAAGHLEACVCPALDAGPGGDVVDAAPLDAAPVADVAVLVDAIATDAAADTDHQVNDVVDAAPVDAAALDAAGGGALDGARADATSDAAADGGRVDAGPVTYDLASPPTGVPWRVLMRTTRGDCDMIGTGFPDCSARSWQVTGPCSSTTITLVAERSADTVAGPGVWALTLREQGGGDQRAERIIVATATRDAGLNMHARFAVPPGPTGGATGIPGRTVDATYADAWLFGCAP